MQAPGADIELPPYSAPAREAPPPLDQLMVLDFSHYLAAPTCTLLLADLGADVVKVEGAGQGDELRRLGPMLGETSASFAWANRNKRAIELDLKSPAGLEVALALVDRADVLVENFSTGVMDWLGLGPKAMRVRNPRLVYCSIPGYAREGPLASRSGFDPVVQAESGLMSLTGHADRPGVRTGTPVADHAAGLFAASAVLAALMERVRSGLGQHVEVSLYDAAIALAGGSILGHLASGRVPTRHGNASREACPTDVYRTQDGELYIACPSDELFHRLAAQVLGRPDWTDDRRFARNVDRMAHAEALRAEMEAVLGTRPSEHWMPLMRAARVPAGVINDLADVVRSSELRARALLSRIPHPRLGSVPSLALPLRFARSPVATPTPAPARGEHTAAVLQDWLGSSVDAQSRWMEQGAFGPGPRAAARADGADGV